MQCRNLSLETSPRRDDVPENERNSKLREMPTMQIPVSIILH
jgi:hypothetical protein